MGAPVEEAGHILRREHWRLWPHKKPPECHFIFQTYDTAFDEKDKNDYSAMYYVGRVPVEGPRRARSRTK
jgi:hypothetical protein